MVSKCNCASGSPARRSFFRLTAEDDAGWPSRVLARRFRDLRNAGLPDPSRTQTWLPLRGTSGDTSLPQACRLLAARSAFYHWRAAGGAEVDLLLERDRTLYPIEIRLTANPARRAASGILAFRAAYPQRKMENGIVLWAVEEPRWIADEVLAMPWNLAGQRLGGWRDESAVNLE